MFRIYIAIFALLSSFAATGQNIEALGRIDSIIAKVDSMASKGLLDTLKGSLLDEGGTSSNLFILKQGRVVQKISVTNPQSSYDEKIIFSFGKPIFAQFTQSNGSKWIYYILGDNAYFKDSNNKFNEGSSHIWDSRIDSYLGLFKGQLDR